MYAIDSRCFDRLLNKNRNNFSALHRFVSLKKMLPHSNHGKKNMIFIFCVLLKSKAQNSIAICFTLHGKKKIDFTLLHRAKEGSEGQLLIRLCLFLFLSFSLYFLSQRLLSYIVVLKTKLFLKVR